MRRVGRLAYRERSIERRRPPSRLQLLSRRAALGAGLLAVLVGGPVLAVQAGLAAAAVSVARLALEGGSHALGLEVVDAFSEGRQATDAAAIARIIQPHVGADILTLDTDPIRTALEQLPWVRSATVSKLLPGTLWIRLTEYAPAALWFDGERTHLVAADGSLLAVRDLRPFVGLPLLTGEGAPAAAGGLLAILEEAPGLARHVTAASRIGERRWNVYLDGRIEVRLPEDAAAQAWLRLADLAAGQDLLGRAIESIDLRSATWTAIRPKAPLVRTAERRA